MGGSAQNVISTLQIWHGMTVWPPILCGSHHAETNNGVISILEGKRLLARDQINKSKVPVLARHDDQ